MLSSHALHSTRCVSPGMGTFECHASLPFNPTVLKTLTTAILDNHRLCSVKLLPYASHGGGGDDQGSCRVNP